MRDNFEEKIFALAAAEKMVLPESMKNRVNDTLVSLPEHRRIFRMTWKKSVVLAAAIVTLMSFTVSAAVGAYRQRMEAMNEQEMEDYFVQIYTSRIGRDNYNRPYTDAETERMKELGASYEEEALFPQEALTMISEPEEYKGKGVAFFGNTSTFFFPEKEMGDEELLQIIDFMHKRDYSLQKMNEMIAEGEMTFPSDEIKEAAEVEKELTDSVILESEAIWDPAQELTIPYTGNLEIRGMAAGRSCIFLTGWNAIHKMEIGSGDSELFFDAFDVETDVTALYQDKKGDIYIAIAERAGSDDYAFTMAGEEYKSALWVLSEEGEIKKKIDLSKYRDIGCGYIRRMAVDEQGYIYVRSARMSLNGADASDRLLLVLDKEGNYVKDITYNLESRFLPHSLAGLGIGKDGRVYTQVESDDSSGHHMGIASVNLEEGCLEDVYLDIVPESTIMLDIIAPGADTDFVFWGYDGIFTYNLGDESAVNVLPAYKAPCNWEGALYCALPDGRIVFGDCSEYRREENSYRIHRIPEKVCFYYKSAAGD